MNRSSTGCASTGVDRVCDALSNADRRRVLSLLLRRRGPATVDELVDSIVESGGTGGRARSRERVRIGLYHAHLPKLDAADFVTHDRDRDVVGLTADRRYVARLLGALGRGPDSADVVGRSPVTVRLSRSALGDLEGFEPLFEAGGSLRFDAAVGAFDFVARLSEDSDRRYYLCPDREDSTFSLLAH